MGSPENALPSIIGAAVSRIDGPLKVSGNAMYTADFHFPGMVYAVPVCSTVAKGKITRLDASDAEKMPGVVAMDDTTDAHPDRDKAFEHAHALVLLIVPQVDVRHAVVRPGIARLYFERALDGAARGINVAA